jgi:hypothetical protein
LKPSAFIPAIGSVGRRGDREGRDRNICAPGPAFGRPIAQGGFFLLLLLGELTVERETWIGRFDD